MDPDAVLETLDPEQRAVATALRGPVRVLAGAGTGKTRAITSRIAYGVHAGILVPQRVLAVTFTTRAAGELRGRLRALGVSGAQARTFHSAALRQLQYFWPRCVGGPLPRIADHKAPLVREAASRCRLSTDTAIVRDLAAEVEWTKVTLTHREDYPAAVGRAGRMPPAGLSPAAVSRWLAVYEDVKRDRNVIDFEDVLVYTAALLDEHSDVAEQVRGQYSSFVVDEYQDVSPLQQQLLDLWLGGRDELCVVGDPSQTIYSFTGATPAYLLDFPARYPQATEVRLIRDYRSTPQVVALANALLRRAGERAGDRAGDAGRAGGGRRGTAPLLQLVAQRPDGPAPEFTEYADEAAEAAGVATRIAALRERGVRAAEMAVLFRTNGQSEAYEQALADAGIPYLLRGGERFFERREVREAHLLLRGAARAGSANAADPVGATLTESVRAVLSSLGWSSTPPVGGAARERWESLSALVALAESFSAARPDATLTELVTELDERAAAQHAPPVEGVTLASLHAAKGLEWDAVFLVGLLEGLLPISYAETPAAVEEERRLLYVGITRAREHVALSWPLARGGRAGRRASRFLDGLRPGSPAATGGRNSPAGRVGRVRRTVATCRSCGRPLDGAVERKLGRCAECPATYDEALFEALRSWRMARAREDAVPAYVVFTDATLTAIAEACPGTEQELALLPGVGRTKLDRYGPEVLALCTVEGPQAGESKGRPADLRKKPLPSPSRRI